jgi:Flp pilus assembly protein TadG
LTGKKDKESTVQKGLLHKTLKSGFRAQALVEFALVIVLLLTIIFGIIEVTRLLFIYATVVTSSREAVRYGSAAGTNAAGIPFYQDCAGIRNTARKLAFFQNLQDDKILITYDKGPATTVYNTCDGSTDTGVSPAAGDRIIVKITAQFTPIVSIVPLKTFPIISTSERTITGIIKLE